jgi:hypothetical protein
MLGNMWEWCHDEFHQVNSTESQFDDINIHLYINESSPRILRGGSFLDLPAYVRSANRNRNAPAYRYTNNGFRPSLGVGGTTAEWLSFYVCSISCATPGGLKNFQEKSESHEKSAAEKTPRAMVRPFE